MSDIERIEWLERASKNGEVMIVQPAADGVLRIVWRDSKNHRIESFGTSIRDAIDQTQ